MDKDHCAAELLIVVCQWFGYLKTKDLVDGFSAKYSIFVCSNNWFSRNNITVNISN